MKQPAANNLYRDSEVKSLIHNYAHKCFANSVGNSLKSDSLPDVSKKASIDTGIVRVSGGSGFKSGKTAVVDMAALHKEESKGAGKKSSGLKSFSDTKLKPASKIISKSSKNLSASMKKILGKKNPK